MTPLVATIREVLCALPDARKGGNNQRCTRWAMPDLDLVEPIVADNGLASHRVLDGRLLVALDGTEHHCSEAIDCPQCSTRTFPLCQKMAVTEGALIKLDVGPGLAEEVPVWHGFGSIVPGGWSASRGNRRRIERDLPVFDKRDLRWCNELLVKTACLIMLFNKIAYHIGSLGTRRIRSAAGSECRRRCRRGCPVRRRRRTR
jgi:hypothetical protein